MLTMYDDVRLGQNRTSYIAVHRRTSITLCPSYHARQYLDPAIRRGGPLPVTVSRRARPTVCHGAMVVAPPWRRCQMSDIEAFVLIVTIWLRNHGRPSHPPLRHRGALMAHHRRHVAPYRAIWSRYVTF